MVFPDGQWYLDPEGEIRGGIVLDNLIHRGDIPVTIGLFVDPGVSRASRIRRTARSSTTHSMIGGCCVAAVAGVVDPGRSLGQIA